MRPAKIDDSSHYLKINSNVDSSESNKSLHSSEYEEKSFSDLSSEYATYHNINVIADCDIEEEGIDEVDVELERDMAEHVEKLAELPPEIAKLVEEALRNAKTEEIHD